MTPPVTGDNGAASAWRVLVGSVDDPLAGTITANGYVDFFGLSRVPSSFYQLPPEQLRAQLKMTRSYQHGDTTATLNVALYDLTEEMDARDATSNQTFPRAATPIRTVSFSANDSLITIDLPTEWIADNIEALRDTTDAGDAFEERFHGFQLATEAGGAVMGFGRGTLRLELSGVADSVATVAYPGRQLFSHVERSAAPPPPDARQVMVGGVGQAVQFSFDFAAPPLDSLDNAPVNRVDLILPVDTTAWSQNRPANFVRPNTEAEYRLLATRADDAPPCSDVTTAALTPEGTPCFVPLVSSLFPDAALVNASTGLAIFQESFLSGSVFTTYRLEVAPRQSSTNLRGIGLPSTLPVVVYGPEAESSEVDAGNLPRASVTVTPL
jgi:hypothetical protein